MNRILAAGFFAALAASPVLAQQSGSVERLRDGYVVHTRRTLADGTISIGEERLPSVPNLLRDFEAHAKNPQGTAGSSLDIAVLAHRELFPRATVDSLLAGYEALASDPGQDQRVAHRAIVSIGMAGSVQERNPVPGQTARLLRIYRAGDMARRFAVLSSLGNTSDERSTAVAFLRGVATLPPNMETEQLVVAAIRALAMMGDAGAATLAELHRANAVRDPEGQFVLQAFAQQGYRSRP